MIKARRLCVCSRKRARSLPIRYSWIASLVLVVASAASSWAHHQSTADAVPAAGISIPSLSHGQMVVIANNRAAILDLAARQIPTDPTMRRLEAFVNLQFFACMWGLVPGSLEDENSPFNECTHAYLAAAQALLLHLQVMPGDRAPVRALVAKIELEMLSNSASLATCRYSDEPFNTADVIGPHWSDIPFHPPSLITFAAFALATGGSGWMVARRKGRFLAAPKASGV
jgi:hypothetical protein